MGTDPGARDNVCLKINLNICQVRADLGTLVLVTDLRRRRIPQQSRSRDRVARLLDTASTLVVSEGVDALGTRGIAAAAGVPVASLYQYFADKDDILLALVERDIEEMDARVASGVTALRAPTLGTLVAATMAAFVEVYRDRPAFVDDLAAWSGQPVGARLRSRAQPSRRRAASTPTPWSLGCSLADTPVRVAEIAVEIGDRLFQLAFEDSLTGEPETLLEAEAAPPTSATWTSMPRRRESGAQPVEGGVLLLLLGLRARRLPSPGLPSEAFVAFLRNSRLSGSSSRSSSHSLSASGSRPSRFGSGS